MKSWGLRPLVLHVDAGWNSEIAVSNIEKIVKFCKFDLYTKVINWEDMRNLQIACLESGIANLDAPQDHIFSTIYNFAIKHKIKYIFTGGNIATESVFPQSWHGEAMDAINLKSIYRKYGTKKLQDYNTVSFFDLYLKFPFFYRLNVIRPLNFMPYNREKAISELKKLTNWHSYGKKHGRISFYKIISKLYITSKVWF